MLMTQTLFRPREHKYTLNRSGTVRDQRTMGALPERPLPIPGPASVF